MPFLEQMRSLDVSICRTCKQFFQMGKHWVELFILGAVVVLGVFALGWYAYQRCFISRQRRAYWPRIALRRVAPKDWFELAEREYGTSFQD